MNKRLLTVSTEKLLINYIVCLLVLVINIFLLVIFPIKGFMDFLGFLPIIFINLLFLGFFLIIIKELWKRYNYMLGF